MDKVRYVDYVNGQDVEVFTDGYAHDEYNTIYLLSVCGQDSAVKAITSALVSFKSVEIIAHDDEVNVDTGYNNKYKILTTKLECGQLHQILLSETFFNNESGEKLIYVEEGTDIIKAVYNQINETYPVPLISEWSQWLYQRIKEAGAITELKGNIKILKLNVTEKGLDELISDGIKSGEISFC
jgi:hypothetical protein